MVSLGCTALTGSAAGSAFLIRQDCELAGGGIFTGMLVMRSSRLSENTN